MLNELAGSDVAASDQTAAEPGQTAAQPPETATTEAPVEQTETKEPEQKRFTQEELDRQIRLRVAREQRKYERRLGELEARVQYAPSQQQGQSHSAAEPTLEQFKDYESYQRALIRHEAEKLVAEREQQRTHRESASAQQQRLAELSRKFEAAEDAARDVHDDYDEVVAAIPKGALPMHVIEAIGESDIGPQLLYRLASEPKLAAEIVRLSPVAVGRRIAAIEAEIAKPKPQTKAPEPVRPLTGRSADASNAPSDRDSADVWLAKRNAEIRARRG